MPTDQQQGVKLSSTLSDPDGDDGAEYLEESDTADPSNNPNSLSSPTSPVIEGVTGGVPQTVSATLPNVAQFQSEHPSQINQLANKDNDLIDEGYDSKGDLLYYLDKVLSQELDYKYNESPIEEEEE